MLLFLFISLFLKDSMYILFVITMYQYVHQSFVLETAHVLRFPFQLRGFKQTTWTTFTSAPVILTENLSSANFICIHHWRGKTKKCKTLPCSSSNSTMSGWLFHEAECNGVSPSLFYNKKHKTHTKLKTIFYDLCWKWSDCW